MSSPSNPSGRLTIAYIADPNSIHTRRWIAWFLDRGHDVHLILASDRPNAGDLDSRVTVHPFPRQSRRWIRFSGVVRARLVLRRVLREINADVLHAHYLTGYGWLAWLAGFHPYVITVWGSDVFLTARESLVARVWARVALGAADLVTADSATLAEATIGAGARRDRSRVIQFGVNTVAFAPGPPSASLAGRLGVAGRRVVFLPRSIAPLYRTTVAVEALAQLPEDVVLILTSANADPSYLAEVRRAIERLGLDNRIRITPPIAHHEIADHLRLADVVLSIPETDATPVSILEAMSCGRPIVATDLPSVREWLEAIEPALLVPVADPVRTARSIERVLGMAPAERVALGERLRDVVIQRGDHDANMREVEHLYHALSSAGR